MTKKEIDFTFPSLHASSELIKAFRIDEATKQGIRDLDNLFQEAVRRANQEFAQKQGFIFEFLEVYKFNQDAVKKGVDFRAVVTSTLEGQGTSPADIRILDMNTKEVLLEAQLKSSKDIYYPMREFFKDKYSGMEKITNPEHADRLKELYQKRFEVGNIYEEKYKDLLKSVKGNLSYKGVSSGGTSYEETLRVANNPEEFVKSEKFKLIMRETSYTAGYAIAVSTFLNIATDALVRKKVDKETMKKVLKESVKSGSGAVILSLLKNFTRGGSNVPAVIANTIVNTIETTFLVARGKITVEEGVIRVGNNTASSMSAIYYAGIGGAVGGPIGAIIGGLIGYAVSSSMFGTLDRILKELKVLRKQTKELEKAFNIVRLQIIERADYLVATIDYLGKLFKDSTRHLNAYLETVDGRHLDKVYEAFGFEKPSDEEIERMILGDEPLRFR